MRVCHYIYSHTDIDITKQNTNDSYSHLQFKFVYPFVKSKRSNFVELFQIFKNSCTRMCILHVMRSMILKKMLVCKYFIVYTLKSR